MNSMHDNIQSCTFYVFIYFQCTYATTYTTDTEMKPVISKRKKLPNNFVKDQRRGDRNHIVFIILFYFCVCAIYFMCSRYFGICLRQCFALYTDIISILLWRFCCSQLLVFLVLCCEFFYFSSFYTSVSYLMKGKTIIFILSLFKHTMNYLLFCEHWAQAN